MQKRQIKFSVVFSFILIFLIGFPYVRYSLIYSNELDFLQQRKINYTKADFNIIAHAGGGVNNLTYINSTETIDYHYDNGTRLYEFDFALSSDGEFIGTHNWEKEIIGSGYSFNNRPTLEEYKNLRMYGEYKGITFDRMIAAMNEYPDIKIVLDFKGDFDEISIMYKKMVDDIKDYDESFLNRFWFQFYDIDMYYSLMDYYEPENKFLSLYRSLDSWESIYRLLKKESDIILNFGRYRASTGAYYFDKLVELDIKMVVSTINSKNEMLKYMDMGIKMFYSDFIFENDFNEAFYD